MCVSSSSGNASLSSASLSRYPPQRNCPSPISLTLSHAMTSQAASALALGTCSHQQRYPYRAHVSIKRAFEKTPSLQNKVLNAEWEVQARRPRISIAGETEGQRDGDTEAQRHRDAERKREREKERKREREKESVRARVLCVCCARERNIFTPRVVRRGCRRTVCECWSASPSQEKLLVLRTCAHSGCVTVSGLTYPKSSFTLSGVTCSP